MPIALPISLARRGLFTIVIFAGSFLLFLVQPMVARFALPRLGGAPGVWNSAMVVFQMLLLGGYAYAHAISRLAFRTQALLHLGLLAAAALTLPVALAELPPAAPGWEALWVPALFLATIGPVFLLLAAQASLIQRWYAGVPGGWNPYRLYAASNIGSFAGLIAYPFWMEPDLALGEQSRTWSIGYLVLIAMVALAAGSRWNVRDPVRPAMDKSLEPVPRSRVLQWLVLAAVPSGLMLSTTTLLTADLMAMPLLWVIPLGLYLLSFPVAFSDHGDWARLLSRYAPVPLLLVGGLAMISGGQANPALALAMAALLFVLAVTLHGKLYALRPGTERLTFFYLAVAGGGALGGVFTALLAPVSFDWVYEHAVLLLAAALLIPQSPLVPILERFWRSGRWARTAALVAVLAAAILAWRLAGAVERGEGSEILLLVSVLVALGLVLIGCRWAFTATFALMMLGHGGLSTLELSAAGTRSRSYFGVYNVEDSADGARRRLTHGTTMHGEQWLDSRRRNEPTAYYGRSSGAGLVLAEAGPGDRIGVAGLGVGTLACYRKPGQDWTFFEIDPLVVRYSRDGTFTFVADCAPGARIAVGDARLELAREPARRFDVLLIDAFTSDAIPLHLLTVEAFATYRRALADDGLLLVHISNRFIDLEPMIAALAREGGWHARIRRDVPDQTEGLSASDWVVLSPGNRRLDRLEQVHPQAWGELRPSASRAWTDDRASFLSLIRF